MPAKIDLTGQRFGRVIVMERQGTRANQAIYLCRCDCGNTKQIAGSSLMGGLTRSCGCLMKERTIERNTTHGMRHTKTYKSWCNMIQRCTNPNIPKYSIYGGRGISVCERWRTFESFLEDMGTRPDGGSLERIDTNGNYEPGNCVWIPLPKQAANRRNNLKITYKGQTRNLCDWAKLIGIKEDTLGMRLLRGWSIQKALTYPKRVW